MTTLNTIKTIMPNILRHEKLNVLPTTFAPDCLYYIKNPAYPNLFDIYMSSSTGDTVRQTATGGPETIATVINSQKNVANGIAGLNENGILAAIDGQDTLLKSNNDYVWDDLVHPFSVKNFTGQNNPTWAAYNGNMQGLIWAGNALSQVWVDVHIRHDFALMTKVYPHVHWLPLYDAAGTIRWGIECMWAKGHGVQKFPTTHTTFYIEQTIGANQSQTHFVTECSQAQALLSADIEPDSVIKFRVFRDGTHTNDTLGDVHAWQMDMHYQRARNGTRNKAPNFFL